MNEPIRILYLDSIEAGDYVTIHTGDDKKYVFIKNDSRLELQLDKSDVPDELHNCIRSNRNVQELSCSQDIEMSDMVVYLLPSSSHVSVIKGLALYPKASCADWNDFHSRNFNAPRRVTKIEHSKRQ